MKILFKNDIDLETLKKYVDNGDTVHVLSNQTIGYDSNQVKMLKRIGLGKDNIRTGSVKDLHKVNNYDLLLTGHDPVLEMLMVTGKTYKNYKVLEEKTADSLEEAIELSKSFKPMKFAKVITLFSYEEIPGIPAAVSGSRPFCRDLMNANKQWTLAELISMSTTHLTRMGLPPDIMKYRGGFYHNPNTDTTTPFCRHTWKIQSVLLP